jgi:anti-sigma B factor antagonist
MNFPVKVVQPSGILSGVQADQFRQEINNIIDAGVNHILADFQDITFMDSSGLGALVMALKSVKLASGRLFLCSVRREVQMLLEIAAVEHLFEIFASRDDFLMNGYSNDPVPQRIHQEKSIGSGT